MSSLYPLNIKDWGEFTIGDFFTVKRGKRIVRDRDYFSDKTDEYPYNVITSTKQNNGVDGFYHSYNCPANSLVCGGEAGGLYTTYQPKECWVMDRARIFTPKNHLQLNKYIALFLATVFSQNQYKYSYGRTPNPDGIESTVIKLPITLQGKPDWDYMMKYIKCLGAEPIKTSIPRVSLPLTTSNWGEYMISDLFIISGTKTTKLEYFDDIGSGPYPYITTQATDNACAGHYDYYTEQGMVLTIDSAVFGYCSFQEKPFSASDHVEKLTPKFQLNKYIALFLVTILNKEQYKYSYGRKCNQEKISQTIIKLPATPNGTPDWEYMENYIKSLPYSDRI